MHLVVLILVSAAAGILACFAVGCLASVLSWIPSAGARKWIVIVTAFLLLLPLAWLVITAVYFPDDYQDLWRIVSDDYRALPRWTLLLFVPMVVGAGVFLAAMLRGFLPEHGIPYDPRGAYWSLGGLLKWFGIVVGLLIGAVLVQDYLLREALYAHQAIAGAVARDLAPPPVDAAENAAVHYQRVVDMMDGIDKWREEGPYDDLTEQLLKCEIENEEIEKYFERLEPMYDELRAAAKCDKCRFDDKYVPLHIIDGMEPRYSLITAMQLARQLSNYRACQARPGEAIAALELIRRFVDHLDADPRARENVFYYWCESWVRQGVEQLTAHGEELPAEELRRLITTESLQRKEIYRGGIAWHAAAIRQHLVNVYSGAEFERDGLRFDQAFGERKGKKIPRWLLLGGMRLVSESDELSALRATFPFTVRPDDDDAWEPRWDEAPPSGVLVSSALSISYLPYWVDRAEANRGLTNIGVAAALYRQDEGQWPESLEALTPKYLSRIPRPSDEDEPFRIKNIDGGMMVYSAQLDERFGEFEDKQAWWEEASDFVHYGYCLFLGRARERLIEFERDW